MGSLLGGRQHGVGQRYVAVHMVERQRQPQRTRKVDKPLRSRRRHQLPALVVTNIPLGAADAGSKSLLGQSKAFANGLQILHLVIISRTHNKVNSQTVLN